MAKEVNMSEKKIVFKNFPVVLQSSRDIANLQRIEKVYQSLIWEFLSDFESELTAKTYWSDLKLFFKWTTENYQVPKVIKNEISFREVTRLMVVDYKKYLSTSGGRKNKPCAPMTIIKKLASIKSFYEFLMEKGLASHNPADSVKRPRAEIIRQTDGLEDSEIVDLFQVVDKYKSKASFLHKAVILTMFGTGIRQGALRKLKFKDLKQKEGMMFLEYFDKGSKLHRVPLHHKVAFHLNEYLDWMESIGRKHEPEDPLFQPTRNNSGKTLKKELNASGISYIVEHYAKMIAKDKKITPHSARASLISSLLASGANIYKVSKDINHSSVSVTARYDKRNRNISDSTFLEADFYKKTEEE